MGGAEHFLTAESGAENSWPAKGRHSPVGAHGCAEIPGPRLSSYPRCKQKKGGVNGQMAKLGRPVPCGQLTERSPRVANAAMERADCGEAYSYPRAGSYPRAAEGRAEKNP